MAPLFTFPSLGRRSRPWSRAHLRGLCGLCG